MDRNRGAVCREALHFERNFQRIFFGFSFILCFSFDRSYNLVFTLQVSRVMRSRRGQRLSGMLNLMIQVNMNAGQRTEWKPPSEKAQLDSANWQILISVYKEQHFINSERFSSKHQTEKFSKPRLLPACHCSRTAPICWTRFRTDDVGSEVCEFSCRHEQSIWSVEDRNTHVDQRNAGWS